MTFLTRCRAPLALLGASVLAGCGTSESSSDPASSDSSSSSSISSSLSSSSSSVSSANDSNQDGFTLLFRDDFNSLDTSRWQLMDHSWGGNLAIFSSSTVSVDNGLMTLELLPAPPNTVMDGETKRFYGAEVRSVQTIEYGRVTARVKFAKGSAVVSSLVTIYTPWPADNWNELDIESLGKDTSEIQYNAMIYDGPPNSGTVTQSVTPTQFPALKSLGFDSAEDFHTYTIQWTPSSAEFYVDGVLQHVWNDRIDLMNLPQNILLTIWASDSPTWAGPVQDDTANAKAVYDWIEVYEYQP